MAISTHRGIQEPVVHLAQTSDGLSEAVAELLSGHVPVGRIGDHLYANGGAKRFQLATQDTTYAHHFRSEEGLIQAHAQDLADLAKGYEDFIVIGPGPAHALENKEMQVIAALLRNPDASLKRIHAIELSKEFARNTAGVFADRLPHLDTGRILEDAIVHTANFREIKPFCANAFVMCTGSLLNLDAANLNAFPSEQMKSHLRDFARVAGQEGMVCLGYDASQDKERLLQAYKTDEVAAFLLHPLERVGLKDYFSYEPEFNADAHMLIHHWKALSQLEVHYNGNVINIFPGSKFPALISAKPDPYPLSVLAGSAGMTSEQLYRSPSQDYCLHTFRCA
ncbi:MAG: L-histidine N(alpha)-methyltransferase [Pseudomonadota bacterium]